MGLLVQRLCGIITNDLQVSGVHEFPENRWREAILFYLFGVWGDKHDVMYRPKIAFGDITLRLDCSQGTYYAYGTPHERLPPWCYELKAEEKLWVGDGKQADVEVALIRFVKDNRIKLLTLQLPDSKGSIFLWKKPRRGEYGVFSAGIPKSWGVNGPIY